MSKRKKSERKKLREKEAGRHPGQRGNPKHGKNCQGLKKTKC